MRDRVVGYLSRPPRVKVQYRGVAQPGRAPALGAGGRWFESSHPDLRLIGCTLVPTAWIDVALKAMVFQLNKVMSS